ncbi:hypothetical protein ACFQ0M_48450, partial [Kitasatospora aburaviensis]
MPGSRNSWPRRPPRPAGGASRPPPGPRCPRWPRSCRTAGSARHRRGGLRRPLPPWRARCQDPRCYVGIIAFEDLGLAALDALGVPFSRMAVVDAPGPRWPDVVAAMEKAFGVLLLGSTEPPGPRT